MDKFASMRVFTAVVDGGSFANAADKLALSRGMVTRYVSQLEAHLGVRLLNRTTRKLSLTEAGADYYQRATQILSMVEDSEAAAARQASVPRGTLRIATSVAFGVLQMGSAITDYLKRYPGLHVDLALNDRVVDLVEEGFDLAIRIGPRVDPGLVARKIASMRIVVCASPAYLKKYGTPVDPDSLVRHNCMTYAYSRLENHWPFRREATERNVDVAGSLRVNNGNVLVSAAVEGLGIIRQPAFLVAEALRKRALIRVLPEWDAGEHAVSAVYPNRQFLPPKVRTFIDFLAERFGRESHWM
jgi:DNA-binding transcriptional LysR family regulator